jgi:amino acid adenylation domain-containing protein/non-ribosomal peptide synthase protein (TIGR01720 family)
MAEDVFVIPTSFAQQRLWVLDQLDPGAAAFNMSAAVRLTGALEVSALGRSLNEVVRRHESLRTTFAGVDGEPMQVISGHLSLPLPLLDLSGYDAATRDEEVRRRAAADARSPFDLAEGPLLRTSLLRLSEREHVLLMTMHHIITDGWSISVFVHEVTTLYGAFVAGEPSPLAEPLLQYADYALWQREWLQGEASRESISYWRHQLAGELIPLQLPADGPRPTVHSYRGGRRCAGLTREQSDAVRRLSNAEGATPFMTLLAAFKALLSRYAGQTDVVVGSPVAGRNRAEVEHLIGFFINTLVLRTELDGATTFRELLRRVREVTLDAYAHQDVPFERLVEELQPERDLSRTPLFQVYFNMLNFPAARVELAGLAVEMLTPPEVESKFDLTLYAREEGDGLRFELVYNAHLFTDERAAEMLAQYVQLLTQAVAEPDSDWRGFSLVTAATKDVLPDPTAPLDARWRGAAHEIFAAHARRLPDKLAVADPRESWSYAELDAWSNRLANHLRAHGVERGDTVAIYAHRSAALVWGVLGVLKAGAAFVILDPAYPPARLITMLEMARPRGWLQLAAAGEPSTQLLDYLAAAPPACRLTLPRRAEAEASGLLAESSADDPRVPIGPDDLAYIAFTSGSTGAPKGIEGRHGPLPHFLPWLERTFGLGEGERFTMLSGLAHDPLQRDILIPLQLGGSVHVPDPEEIPVPGRMIEWMAREGITVTNLTPAMAQLLTETGSREAPAQVASLRYVITVGDVLTRRTVSRLRRMAPTVTCVNFYGSTETQRAVSYFVVPPEWGAPSDVDDGLASVVPLGRGVEDVQLLLLNQGGGLAGVGEAGEIYLRSPHIARGYLGDEALTRERFIANPFTGVASDRLYRTGDLGRYLPDGNVEPLGRADQQVKIRGFRVEPGEVEAELRKHPSVREAVVVARDFRGDKRLVGYFVADEAGAAAGSPRLESELRRRLQERFPDYMVPSYLVRLDRLPLTPTGKIDRRGLPEPSAPAPDEGEDFVAPRHPVEEVLADIWAATLGVERVGARDNFFALGGHSLLATQVVARARAAFGVELPLRRLFERPTVAGMAEFVTAALRAGEHSAAAPLVPAPRGGELPLSFAQQRLWFLDQLEPGGVSYNVGAAVRLTGALDAEALRRSLREVVNRHEALRTTFVETGGQSRQQVASEVEVPFEFQDLGLLPVAEREAETRRGAAAEMRRPFDLARGPLLRLKLLRLAADEHVMVVTMHHIISDGWSSGVLIRELAALYEAYSAGAKSPLAPLPVQYADYALWQRRLLTGEALAGELTYWRERLAGAPTVLELPTDRPRPPVFAHRGARHHFALGPELVRALTALGRQEGATLFMTLLAAYQTLLSRHSGQEDISVGSPIAGRTQVETEGLIGYFANTLVLRTDLSGDPTFRELLGRVRETSLGAYAHQDVPFEMLVERLQPERSLSHTPLFQAALTLQSSPAEPLHVRGLALAPLEVESGTAKFDLLLTLEGEGESLRCFFEYNTDIFDGETIARMAGHFRTLLEGVVASPDDLVTRLPLLTDAERERLLSEWAGRETYARGESLHRLFERQAARTPDATAVTYEDERLSYAELNTRANVLARRLRGAGVADGTVVGVLLERSAEMVVGLLAVLKAGGAYLPLNPSDPPERLAFMLEDAGCPVVLTRSGQAVPPPPPAGDSHRLIFVDEDDHAEGHAADNLDEAAGGDHLAYVIYTSGSTGQPKGVQVTHDNAARLFAATDHWFRFGPEDVWTLFHSYTFDFSVWEMWGALLYGGRLVVAPYWVSRSPESFYELVCRERVTVLNQTPSAFRQFIEAERAAPSDLRPSLRYVVFGGEALDPRSLKPWVERHGDTRPQLVNMYGITETTVHVTYRPLAAADIEAAAVSPIGGPIPDLQVYVLDRHLQPVPFGVRGEMYVGGDGLARGYLGRPALTAERFIAHPFSKEPGARLYRTGDLARQRADGTLEYLGRADNQVKVRGFRIELGEIEAALASHPAVGAAVVLAPEEPGGARRLVAYVVAAPGAPAPTSGELQGFLKERLPDYMAPHACVTLDALPLTTNGKIDRKALLALDRAPGAADGEGFVPARTPAEKILAAVWAEVLRVERVGANDNFFELGGDSILSIQIVSKARQAGLRVTPKQLFQHQTVAALAAEAEADTSTGAHEDEASTGPVPLTPIQSWFFEQKLARPDHYNQAVLLQTERPLDTTLLARAVSHLLARHDALRLRFRRGAAGWEQVALAPCAEPDALDGATVERVNLSAVPEEERRAAFERACAEAQAGLDLANGPLLRVVVFDAFAGQPARLLIVIHHLAVDGVSWRILLEEFETVYAQLERGEEVSLPHSTASFRRWARALGEYARGEELGRERGYWLDAGARAFARLPVSHATQPPTYATARTVVASLDEDETRALLRDVPAASNARVNDVLLASLALAFRARYGFEALRIDLEGHGREELSGGLDTSRTVGWFTAQFPVLLEAGAGRDAAFVLRSVKERLRAVPRGGIGYGLLHYLRGDEELSEALRAQPRSEVRFNYLGQFDRPRESAVGLSPAAGDAGLAVSPDAPLSHLLDINLRVVGGRLEASWRYSEETFVRAEVEETAAAYFDELRGLSALCRRGDAAAHTPSDFPLARVEPRALDALAASHAPLEDLYPLSPLQQGLLFHMLEAPRGDMYFLHLSCRFEGALDREAFRRACEAVVARHPVLRTAFVWQGLAEPLQVVSRTVALPWEEHDWRGAEPDEQRERLETYLRENRARGMELSRAPLVRLALFRLDDDAHHFVWSSHHIVLDGWSYPVLIREMLHCYDAFRRGLDPALTPSRPYRDYIAWLGRQDLSAAREYWRGQLAGFTTPTPLGGRETAGRETPEEGSHTIRKLRLSPDASRTLRDFARSHQLTMNTLVKGAWALMLGGDDVVFGSVVSGRPVDLEGAETMIGLLINTLPLRVRTSPREALLLWLRRLQEQQIEMQQYEYSPLVEVQRWSDVPRGLPMFESIISFLNYPVEEAVARRGGPLSVREVEFLERVNYPLALVASAREVVELELKYDRRRFDEAAAAHMLEVLERLLTEFAARPEASVEELRRTVSEAGGERREERRQGFREARRRALESAKQKTARGARAGKEGE